jgi:hypothetical protein
MQFTADQVWGAACAAQRINDGYFKETQYGTKDGFIDTSVILKRANKEIVKAWLRSEDFTQITEADYAAGRTARDHFKGYTLLAIAGKLNDFQNTAMQIAAKDEFTGRDMYDFAVISCLPSVALRDAAKSDLKREIYASEQLQGAEGDTVQGEINVVNTRFNPEYNKYRITARMGEAFIDFWLGRELSVGTNYTLKGKIKRVRGDKTTQLNYVKITG